MTNIFTNQAEALRLGASWGLFRPMRNEYIILTGKMSIPRAVWHRIINAAGGAHLTAVTIGTTLVVQADDDDTETAKVQGARRRGIPVIKESAFVAALLPTAEELETGFIAPFSSEALR